MPPIDPYLQLGSFGVMAFVIFWYVWYGYPAQAKSFKDALDNVVSAFVEETGQCRAERLDLAATNLAEREKDRKINERWARALAKHGIQLDTPDPDKP